VQQTPPAESQQSTSLLPYILGIVVIGIILGVVFVMKKKRPMTEQQKSTVIATKAYIQQMLQRGYTRDQIKQELQQTGYSQDIIDEAFKDV
jgi:hypothetical protein